MSRTPCWKPSSILLKLFPLFHVSGDGGHHPPGAHPVRHAPRHRRAVLGDRDPVAEAVPGGGVLGTPGEGELVTPGGGAVLRTPGGGELGTPGEAVAGASHHLEHQNKMCCICSTAQCLQSEATVFSVNQPIFIQKKIGFIKLYKYR